ncbi:MAG: cyclic nucleotide-binding domain-containing protein [Flavobacterium sp.]|nr:cyclic nucleotide-binding domain-containing protein [Flavobacterium sp.]
MEKLRIILNEKVSISESDWEFISSKLYEKEYRKKDLLTSTNTIENKIYFILEGVFRLFIELPEKDVTIDFGFPNRFLSSYSSFLTQTPSVACIQSLTKSKVIYISREDLHEIYKKQTQENL